MEPRAKVEKVMVKSETRRERIMEFVVKRFDGSS
jgi:hypothetical protein